jgi:hypothetical protein
MQSDLTRQRDLRRRTSDKQIEVSRRHRPCVVLDVIIGERSPIEFHDDVLGLTRIQAYSLEAFQFFYRARNGSMPIANGNGGEAYFAAIQISTSCPEVRSGWRKVGFQRSSQFSSYSLINTSWLRFAKTALSHNSGASPILASNVRSPAEGSFLRGGVAGAVPIGRGHDRAVGRSKLHSEESCRVHRHSEWHAVQRQPP